MKSACLLMLLLMCGAVMGCHTPTSARIAFIKPNARQSVYQSFPGAYISSNRDGEYDVVLVNDTLRAAKTQSAEKPLTPVTEPPLQQAIHIHIFWRPVAGAMVKESSITNAIVHWYVFGNSSANTDMVHYEGAAFVKLDSSGATSTIHIGDGLISARQIRGPISDPIGRSRINGMIYAVRNDARVRELMSDLKDKAAGKEGFWTAEAGADATPAVGQ